MLRLLLLLVCSAALAFAQGQSVVWFAPLDPLLRPEVGYGGSPQYMQLFTPDAAWPTAASRVQVFKIYPQWLAGGTDDDLSRQFADLQRRGIALAVEFPALSPTLGCGQGVEGFGPDQLMSSLQRIKTLGFDLAYLAMDEPIYFATLYKGRNACGWTVQQAVNNAAVNLKAIRAMFPNVQIGDIEPFPATSDDFVTQYAQGLDAFQAALGFPLAFFHSDLDWNNAPWKADLDAMRVQAQARAIPFGVIYDGDPMDASDAAWTDSATRHMAGYETRAGVLPPDHVIFQSWHAWPRKLLPETDSDSFTALINRYFRARTTLTLAVDQGSASGNLSNGPGGLLQLMATPLTGDGQPAEYTVTGVTPAGVQQIIFGVRVNLECGCSGPGVFSLGGFQLDFPDSGEPSVVRDFTNGLAGWSVSDATLAVATDGVLQVSASAGQPLMVNSAPVAFTNGNAAFRLTVPARVNPISIGSGDFIIVFLGASGEINRFQIPIRPAEVALGTATTADDGGYQFALPPVLAEGTWLLRALYAGSEAWWPAAAEFRLVIPPGGVSQRD